MTTPPPDSTDEALPPGRPVVMGVAAAVVAGLVLAGLASVTLLLSLNARFSHDEHQFIAPAVLLWRGFVPNLDYLYLHMPVHALLNAVVVPLHDNPLLTARLLSAAMGVAIFLVLYDQTRRALGPAPVLARVAATGLVTLLATTPVFAYAVTKSWNHGTSGFFSVLAFVLTLHGAGGERDRRWAIASAGACAALAVGCRLTAAPLFAPLGLGLLFLGEGLTPRRVLARCGLFAAGAAVGLLPVVLIAAPDPWKFYVGNVHYPRYSNAYHRAHGEVWTPVTKVLAFVDFLVGSARHVLLLALLTVVVTAAGVVRVLRRAAGFKPLAFALLVLLFVAVGAYTPGRLHLQYNFAPAVFGSFVIAIGLGYLVRHGLSRVAVAAVLAASAVVGVAGYKAWLLDQSPRTLLRPSAWLTTRVEALGRSIAEKAKGRPVITFAPVFALAGGAAVPPAFATGPFVWRTAPYVEDAKRRRLGWCGPEELPAVLEAAGEAVILVGWESGKLNADLTAAAEAAGLAPVKAGSIYRRTLEIWVPAAEIKPDKVSP